MWKNNDPFLSQFLHAQTNKNLWISSQGMVENTFRLITQTHTKIFCHDLWPDFYTRDVTIMAGKKGQVYLYLGS